MASQPAEAALDRRIVAPFSSRSRRATAARTVADRCCRTTIESSGARHANATPLRRHELLAAAVGDARWTTPPSKTLISLPDRSRRARQFAFGVRRCRAIAAPAAPHRRTDHGRRRTASSQLSTTGCPGARQRPRSRSAPSGPERYGPDARSCSRPSSIPGTAIGAASARCRSKISQCTIGRGPSRRSSTDGDGQQPARR